MTFLCYTVYVCSTPDCALPLDLSVLQLPVLCPSTCLFYGRLCSAHGRVCSTDACALPLNVSVLRQTVLCPWTCLFYSCLCCVCSTGYSCLCSAPGRVCSTADCALPLDLSVLKQLCGVFLGCVESVLLVTKQTKY